jgi:hypothetical protein
MGKPVNITSINQFTAILKKKTITIDWKDSLFCECSSSNSRFLEF